MILKGAEPDPWPDELGPVSPIECNGRLLRVVKAEAMVER